MEEGDLASHIGGFCQRCQSWHTLPSLPAHAACQELMGWLARHQTIALFSPQQTGVHSTPAAPAINEIKEENEIYGNAYSTDYLYGLAGGKMFGVLIGRDTQGQEVQLYAFSGQYNSQWSVYGWADPLFSVQRFTDLVAAKEPLIKLLTRRIDTLTLENTGKAREKKAVQEERARLKKERRQLSQSLMQEIHGLYTVGNFRGEYGGLQEAFLRDTAPPTGTGDCCAPKLINMAQRLHLRPESCAEFFWGRANPSATKEEGIFYPPCETRCQALLGFMLCGLEGR